MRPKIVVEVSRGVVQAIYADHPVDVVLADWDDKRCEDPGNDVNWTRYYPLNPLSDVPKGIADEIKKLTP